MIKRPSKDAQAHELAHARRDDFAAWRVQGRSANQLLLRDVIGRTYSWLMVEAITEGDAGTRLHFGSAVLPKPGHTDTPPRLDFTYHALLGFHDLYSRALLKAARSRVARSAGRG